MTCSERNAVFACMNGMEAIKGSAEQISIILSHASFLAQVCSCDFALQVCKLLGASALWKRSAQVALCKSFVPSCAAQAALRTARKYVVQVGSRKLLCASCSAQVALRRSLCAGCSWKIAVRAQVLFASFSVEMFLQSCSTQACCASWSAQVAVWKCSFKVALCKRCVQVALCKCSAQVALRKCSAQLVLCKRCVQLALCKCSALRKCCAQVAPLRSLCASYYVYARFSLMML